eukprot:TRINITY_DN10502_c0_g1_i2.p1 TRINITY_DN10502_c0_g1~~TRINITY_DN10502_c0_g1_i2.p1  ORF type:complete len:184 (+),score=21.95 TRINITY_DN10502_c0_g1_i2:268-819(+)
MWMCRMCAGNPFTALFGEAPAPRPMARSFRRQQQQQQKQQCNSRVPRHVKRRSDDEVEALVQRWLEYAHARSHLFFSEQAALEAVLRQIAQGVEGSEDPVLGTDSSCVQWCGDLMADESEAAVLMQVPGASSPCAVYLNRITPFVFGTDHVYQQLSLLPTDMPFRMVCGNPLCCKLGHISLSG